MKNWFMLTLVGQDQSGIVAQVTQALYQGGCNLGEASMVRLGGNFTMMLMVNSNVDESGLAAMLSPVADKLQLHVHLDAIEGRLHQHPKTDVCINVYGADRSGMVAEITARLAAAGLNIVDLSSDVGGVDQKPIYIMQIEGVAEKGMAPLQQALDALQQQYGHEFEVHLSPIDTLIM
ncbi:glycine cleavage system protein R [Candidatus Venteria ishoeyi]|uniref:Glycine cleavage system transcriptional repressor n=1 Tax=Candidatus Venteria ishoeyi TaxID=1899563 RepID=A0A1H6F522_9GAMM|nr:ACT domain-containing protein [Candidatus Venteria ishoeyi]MDM8548161.1 ACT domain-containing protein [Candidatus Venteria ishoeyi]SEH05202.1 Glycine cleavage system transcriptional repressor [Candidatus Venteria ishoeyi]